MPRTNLREPAFLVLAALAGRPQHGYTLIEDIQRLSEGRVRLRTGTIYSLLERLLGTGLIEVEREEVVASRLRRYYRLSEAGATVLSAESEALRRRANTAVSLLQPNTRVPSQHGSPTAATDATHTDATRTDATRTDATRTDALCTDGADAAVAAPRSDRFVHPALFYRTMAQYLDATVAFVLAGLEAGEPVAVAVPGERLAAIGVRLGHRAGQVHMVDMSVAGRNPGRIIPTVLLAFAEEHQGRPVRIVGEPIWPSRTPTEYPACVVHEALTNVAFAERAATILCPYDAANLAPTVLSDAARTHPLLTDDTGTRPSGRYAVQDVLDDYNLPLSEEDIARAEVFEFDASNCAVAPTRAVTHAVRCGLPTARGGDVEIVVGELASNSIRHGGGRGRLAIGTAPGSVVLQVQDAGTVSDPMAGRRLVAAGQSGGRGLLTVNRAADLVRAHLTADRTTVRAYFDNRPQ